MRRSGRLRDTSELLLPAVSTAIKALETEDADAATVKLAEQYARTIDGSGLHCADCQDPDCKRENNSWAMRWMGPLLLDALESLGATPIARSRLKTGKPADAKPSGLQKLRDARRA